MREPNKMFLDPAAHAFVAACVLGFALGVLVVGRRRRRTGAAIRLRPLGRIAILVPLLVAVGLNLVSVSIFIKNNPNLLVAWLIDAAAAKREFDATGGLTEALPLLFGVCWWGLWRLLERESSIGKADWILRMALGIAFAFAVGAALVKVARYDLMPGMFGLALVYLVFRHKQTRLRLRRYILSLAGACLTIVGLFVLLSWLRGSDTQSDLLNNVTGYTAASYNRLSAVLSSDLRLPYGGSGTYAFRFLDHIPLLHRWVDIGALIGIPESIDVWSSEFPAVYRAGLDGRYIWASAFGYVYSDVGVFVFVYFFVIGALSGRLWGAILASRSTGVLLYPWFAFSILFWFGSNYVAYPRLITFAVTGLLLVAYERVLGTRKRHRRLPLAEPWIAGNHPPIR